MVKLKVTALAAALTLAFLPTTKALAAGPLLAPWVIAHAVGTAVRLATLPIAIASAVAQASSPAGPGYYGSGGYYAAPGYYPPPAYSSPPAYYPAAGYYPQGYSAPFAGYYGGPQRDYPGHFYRPPSGYLGSSRGSPSRRGYYSPTARYSAGYGRSLYGGSHWAANRRW